MTDSEYAAWLADAKAIRLLLNEVVVSVAGVETTLYISTGGYTSKPTDTPANQSYRPVLSKNANATSSLALSGDSAGMGIGDLEYNNVNGACDSFLTYVWSNRVNKLYLGDSRWPRSDFRLVYSGITDDMVPKSRTALGVKLRDKLQQLNVEAVAFKLGGTSNNRDAVVPSVLGEVFNMTPLLVSGTTYQGHYGIAEDFPEVRDNGLPVSYTKDLANGKFTLVRSPAGAITCDVQGSSDGGTSLGWVSAQRWRLRFTAVANPAIWNVAIVELQFREVPGVSQLFSGGTIVASTETVGNEATKAADNNTSTYWVATWPFNTYGVQTWEYQFASTKAIAEYTIRLSSPSDGTRPTSWVLEYWNGTAWITADTRTGYTWVSAGPDVFSVTQVPVTPAGSYLNTISTLVQRLVTSYGPTASRFTSGDLDATQLAAFDSANPQPVGIVLEDRVNVLNVCRALASSVGAQLSMSLTGLLRLLRITAPGTSIRNIGITNMVEQDIYPSTRPPVIAAVQLGFNKNWTVQDGLTSSLSALDKDDFSIDWLSSTQSDSTVAANYKLSVAPVQQDTMLLKRTDADAEATRQLNIWKVQKQVYQFTAYAEMFDLQLGDTVTITHPRFGLSAGVPALVVSLSPTWANSRIVIGVLI